MTMGPEGASVASGLAVPEELEGIIVSHQANFYYVKVADVEYAAHVRGRLKKEGEMPLVGDRVRITLEPVSPDEPLPPPRKGSLMLAQAAERGVRRAFLSWIAPRKHVLERPAIANVDQLLVVMAADSPAFSPFLLDKFLVVATKSDLTPVIVINKRDLVTPERLAEIVDAYAAIGYQVIPTAFTPDGVRELVLALGGKLSVLAGPSGVGKSSLVNAIQPGLRLAEGEVSTKLQRGRHTTRHAALYPVAAVAGALLADTPGFSFLALDGVAPAELGWLFPEMAPYVPTCRLPSCLHVHEPDCAVKTAPGLTATRYESYLRLLEECTEADKGANERSRKVEGTVKTKSGRAGVDTRLVKVDAADRAGDRRTRNQQFTAHWHEDAEEGDALDLDTSEDADSTGGI